MNRSDLTLIAQTRADVRSGRAREIRDAAGLSQAAVAAAVGVCRQAVTGWENGTTSLTDAHALAYGRLLRDLARKAA